MILNDLIRDLFDKETGFFKYLIDKKCFYKKNARRASRLFPKMKLDELIKYAESAYSLQEGIAEELLIELSKRIKNSNYVSKGNQ